MFKVVAERIDPQSLVWRQAGYWSAISFSMIPAKDVRGGSYAQVTLENGETVQLPVSSRDKDYQCVIGYGASGEVVEYMKSVKGVVTKHLGPTVDRD